MIAKVDVWLNVPLASLVNVLKAFASAPWTPVLPFIAVAIVFAASESELKLVANAEAKALNPLIFTSAAAILAPVAE